MTAPSSARFTVRVVGWSMRPLLRDADRVEVDPVPASEIRPGDIIAFRRGATTITHRVLDVRREGEGLKFREKGDNNRTSLWVDARDCLGRAVCVEREGRRCPLDVSADSIRLHAIVTASRAEAGAFEWLLRAGARHGQPSRPDSAIAISISALLWPVRTLIRRVLLTVYHFQSAPEESDAAIAWLLDTFRKLALKRGSIAGPPPGDDPKAGADLLAGHGLDALADEAGAGDWPIDFRARLKLLRHRSAFQSMVNRASLSRVAGALAGEGIRYAVLKGGPLAARLYGHTTLRASQDLDVWVAPCDVDRALAALARAGLKCVDIGWRQGLVRRYHFHFVMVPDGKGLCPVELHWALVDRANLYRIDEEEVRRGIRLVDSEGVAVGCLRGEDEFIYLCAHLAKHAQFNRRGLSEGRDAGWFCRAFTGLRLIWMLDLQRYLERHGGEFDWAMLRARAERWNAIEDVADCLRVLDLLLPDGEAAKALHWIGRDVASGARRPAWLGSLLSSGPGRAVLDRMLRADSTFVVRPVRLLGVWRLLFPPASELTRFHRLRHRAWVPLARLAHPAVMLARLAFGG